MNGFGGILTEDEIQDRLTSKDWSRRIFITPFLGKDQIGHASIDVRLGNNFIAFRRTKYATFDPMKKSEEITSSIASFQEKIYIPLGKRLFLHPQQLVLGCTLEYIRLPNDLVAEVMGRSSWGRLGLILSAATLVHPGYAGVITLELANEGDVTLPLIPGVRIAQLVFKSTMLKERSKARVLKSRYLGSIEPTFSKIHEDDEMRALGQLG